MALDSTSGSCVHGVNQPTNGSCSVDAEQHQFQGVDFLLLNELIGAVKALEERQAELPGQIMQLLQQHFSSSSKELWPRTYNRTCSLTPEQNHADKRANGVPPHFSNVLSTEARSVAMPRRVVSTMSEPSFVSTSRDNPGANERWNLKSMWQQTRDLFSLGKGFSFESFNAWHEGDDAVQHEGVLSRIVRSPNFEYFMGLVVVANCINIGAELERGVHSQDPRTTSIFEYFFLVAYAVELALRVRCFGWRIIVKHGWTMFDTFIFIQGLVAMVIDWFVEPEFYTRAHALSQSLLVLRVMRVLRLLRALRLLRLFTDTWRVVHGLLLIGWNLFSMGLVVATALYVFACIGLELITMDGELRQDDAINELVQEKFQSLPGAMLTLLSFVTLDGVADVYAPLILKKPYLLMYFLPILLIISIAFMNLVTALVLENAIKSIEADREVRRMRLRRWHQESLPEIRRVFRALDSDGDGQISVEDIQRADPELVMGLGDGITLQGLTELFPSLDDDAGYIGEDEWAHAFLLLRFNDQPIEMRQVLQLQRALRRRIDNLSQVVMLRNSHHAHGTEAHPAALCTTASGSLEPQDHNQCRGGNRPTVGRRFCCLLTP